MDDEPIDEIEQMIEQGYATMMTGFYKLRVTGQHQREYDTIGRVLNLLMEDRSFLRQNHQIKC